MLRVTDNLGIAVKRKLTITTDFPVQTYTGVQINYSVSWPQTNFGPYYLTVDYGDGSPIVQYATPLNHYASTHLYTVPSTYHVRFTIEDSMNSGLLEFDCDVRAMLSIVNFSATNLEPLVGESIIFTASVQGGFPGYEWRIDFKDGMFDPVTGWNSYVGNISSTHVYEVEGGYNVVLTVQDALGTATMAELVVNTSGFTAGIDWVLVLLAGAGIVGLAYVLSK